MTNKTLIIVLIIILALGAIFFWKADQANAPEEGVACTMDAMECPDGSFVGRVPPQCNFAPCPGGNAVPEQSTPMFEDGTLPETEEGR